MDISLYLYIIHYEEAAKAVALHKIQEEEFFSELGETSDFDQHCNRIDNNLSFKLREVKVLCIKLVCHLDMLSQSDDSERNNYCNYIRFWLNEHISEIHTINL
ncbi:CYIR protein [Plasmodium cynomolgi strain B]|uniref:CYIR protein n=1 Tax=Plasmodium cynomolgi (strain B) TaxID=1120755 RepID=K6V320_PLACD|nr:CYIR protein [Plasmodium cynomolgi strain B]GAB69725.1 CYIR protein [Plasmodium cynomolgi strain B]